MTNPKTAVLRVGGQKFVHSNAENELVMYSLKETPDAAYSERKPPRRPEKSRKSVSNGSASVHAMTRGTTRNLKESMESDSMASICSVARMLERTAPIPEPTRPATSKPVTSGPISKKNASA